MPSGEQRAGEMTVDTLAAAIGELCCSTCGSNVAVVYGWNSTARPEIVVMADAHFKCDMGHRAMFARRRP